MLTKDEAVQELESVIFFAIRDGLDQDHAHTPYVKVLNLDMVSDDDLKTIAKHVAKELAKKCESPPARAALNDCCPPSLPLAKFLNTPELKEVSLAPAR